MSTAVQQNLDNTHVTFVDSDVQGCLLAFIARVQISLGLGQQFNDSRFVAERRVVDGPIAVFILQKKSRDIARPTSEKNWFLHLDTLYLSNPAENLHKYSCICVKHIGFEKSKFLSFHLAQQ